MLGCLADCLSSAGYLAIYLIGIASGIYTLPPDTDYSAALHLSPKPTDSADTRRRIDEKKSKVRKAKPGKLAVMLASWSIVWWGLYGITRAVGFEVSRRVVSCFLGRSLSPTLTFSIAGQLPLRRLDRRLQHLIHPCLPPHPSLGLYKSTETSSRRTSNLRSLQPQRSRRLPRGELSRTTLTSELTLDVKANLLTGLVNVSIESMYASDSFAIFILLVYCAGVVGAAWALRNKRLRM